MVLLSGPSSFLAMSNFICRSLLTNFASVRAQEVMSSSPLRRLAVPSESAGSFSSWRFRFSARERRNSLRFETLFFERCFARNWEIDFVTVEGGLGSEPSASVIYLALRLSNGGSGSMSNATSFAFPLPKAWRLSNSFRNRRGTLSRSQSSFMARTSCSNACKVWEKPSSRRKARMAESQWWYVFSKGVEGAGSCVGCLVDLGGGMGAAVLGDEVWVM